MIAGIGGAAFLTTALGGAPLLASGVSAALIGAKNYIKKHTHYTKEQKAHEQDMVRNYDEEMGKIRKWEKILNNKDS